LSEVEDFFRERFEADTQEEIRITGERMLAIRDLFSMIITQRFGHDQQNIFSFGFLLTNVVYMCENPDIVPMYKDFIEENLNSLIEKAKEIGIPTKGLSNVLNALHEANKSAHYENLYSMLCDLMGLFEDEVKSL
jgi:hypothetical protein